MRDQERIAQLETENAARRAELSRQGEQLRQALETIAQQTARSAKLEARLAKESPNSSKLYEFRSS